MPKPMLAPLNPVHAPPSRATSRKISSPANMLPNSRMPSDTDLAAYSMMMSRKLNGVSSRPTTLRSEEHTSELPPLMRISYAVFCLLKIKRNVYIFNHLFIYHNIYSINHNNYVIDSHNI